MMAASIGVPAFYGVPSHSSGGGGGGGGVKKLNKKAAT